MNDVKESIRAYWDKEADGFDLEFGHGLRDQEHKTVWLNILRRNLRVDRTLKILDVGCGTGFLSILLAELGHNVTGLDFAPQMLNNAREKSNKKRLNIDFRQGDAEKPPFRENTFDLIICRHLIWTLPDPDTAITSWKELLKPGGAIIMIEGCWRVEGLRAKAMRAFAWIVQFIEQRKAPSAWEKSYVPNIDDLPLFGGRPSAVLGDLLFNAGFDDIKKDGLEDLLKNENSHAPLSYRIRCSHLKERRFLLRAEISQKNKKMSNT